MPGAATNCQPLAIEKLVVFNYPQKQWYKEPMIQ